MKLQLAVLLGLVAASASLARQSSAPSSADAGGKIVDVGPGKDVVLPEPTVDPQRKAPKVIGWPAGRTPTPLPGFHVTLFADNLQFPRWIYVLPNGDVLVTEAGGGENDRQQINLFRDVDEKGTAKVREVFLASGYKRPHGMLLLGKRFFVAYTDRLMAYPYQTGQTKITAPGEKIADLPNGGLHTARTLVANANGTKLFVTVGSFSDSDIDAASLHEPERAVVLEMNPDGSGRRVFATGLRNPEGIAIEPKTKALWVAVNERGFLGDRLPPDIFTSVHEGSFYGWPYFYWGRYRENRLNRPFPSELPKPVVPDYALGSHVAPLGLTFYQGRSFPKQYQGGAFIAEHGSSGRSSPVGYKVVYLPFVNGQPQGLPQDFLTGFLANEETVEAYGRPVGLAVLRDGSLLVADDVSGKVWKVSVERPPRF
jgi:glucose/arabinose dehydrogenase